MSADESTPRAAGRRERNKDSKRTRIFDAAATLFAEHGFAAVTTQQVALTADVATGTVFRYASSKAELLLMVYNVELERAILRGQAAATAAGDRASAVDALLAPVIDRAAHDAENTLAYQRELLFGSATERYRLEGVELTSALVARIAAIIAQPNEPDDGALVAARAVFGAMHLALVEICTGGWPVADPRAVLSQQVRQVIAGRDQMNDPG